MRPGCEFVTADGAACKLTAYVRILPIDVEGRAWEVCTPHAEAVIWASNQAYRTRKGMLPVSVVYARDFEAARERAERQ